MWNPDVYRQFQAERDRPFFDLTAQLPDFQPAFVTDLGCGTAHQTATLAERWPEAQVTGVDSSAEMLAQAAKLRNLRLVQADFSRWLPDTPQDLLLSNAALQWVPGHPALVPRLAAQVAPGGVFAFQVPGNFTAPSHLLLAELRSEPRWSKLLGAPERGPQSLSSLDPLEYADLLTPLGFRVDAWETTYLHLLHGPDAVLNWVRGTALRPVLARLSPGDAAEFEAEYGLRLRVAYPQGPSGTAFPFRRVFVVARRTA
ncbi:methyltransferase domain-containing protein [Deinococcus radiomollis]|uniref:methyltransferase domain-containing protein n=1 Tax=Deinococcus radiomollis TaxID=468916 RepID=UPI003892C1CE